MLKRNLILGSAASLAFAFAAAGLSNAQPYSTPAEHSQTEALNAQQASVPGILPSQDATAAAALPGTTVVALNENQNDSATLAYNNALAAQTSAQSQYNSQASSYGTQASGYAMQEQAYQQKLDAYNREKQAYEQNLADLNNTTVVAAVPVGDEWVTIYPAGYRRLVIFNTIANPDLSLHGATVLDRMGYAVGNFRHFTRRNGEGAAVITLNNNETVVVGDQHLRYDPLRNIVIADLTYNQLEERPA